MASQAGLDRRSFCSVDRGKAEVRRAGGPDSHAPASRRGTAIGRRAGGRRDRRGFRPRQSPTRRSHGILVGDHRTQARAAGPCSPSSRSRRAMVKPRPSLKAGKATRIRRQSVQVVRQRLRDRRCWHRSTAPSWSVRSASATISPVGCRGKARVGDDDAHAAFSVGSGVAHGLAVDEMDAAFGLWRAAPTAGARVFARLHRAGAGRAADGGDSPWPPADAAAGGCSTMYSSRSSRPQWASGLTLMRKSPSASKKSIVPRSCVLDSACAR